MANELKVTKLQTKRDAASPPNSVALTCYFVNTAVTPNVPGSVTTYVTEESAYSSGEIQDAIDVALALVTSNTIDWSK